MYQHQQQIGGTRTPPPQSTESANLGKRHVEESSTSKPNLNALSPQQKRQRIDGEVTSSSSAGDKRPTEIDFSYYTKTMLGQPLTHTYKSDLIQLKKLKGTHDQENKLSDKMFRRDICFYDLYKLKESRSELHALEKEGYHWAGIYDEEIYEDIEVQDYNVLWEVRDAITAQFGKSIKVSLKVNQKTVERHVTEDLSLAKIDQNLKRNTAFGGSITGEGGSQSFTADDVELQILTA